jgi:ADP-heptose:LPS heptosyltransferase
MLRKKEIDFARRVLSQAGVGERFVVVHPGSGGSAESWPFDRFVRLYRELKSTGLEVVISGSDQEGVMIDAICRELGVTVTKITGDTDLRTLAGVLSLATVVVANSTGPLHLATAVGTSVVGLYPSKRVMSPVRWGPLGKNHRVIQPLNDKCECPPKQCTCMETIPIELVAHEVESLFTEVASRVT